MTSVCKFKEYKKSEVVSGHLHMGETSPNGEHIDVTNRFLTKDNEPWIGVMGEYHFSRYSHENWKTELEKMKAGGVSIVSTYLFWIYHEEIEGEYIFLGDLDVHKFIETAKELGLSVVIRIGPWAHGECRNGGFPDWILKKGLKLRDNNAEYMALVEDWYRHIYEQVKDLLYKNGGNIIGIQFENELVNNAEHLAELKKLALKIGFSAPIYTVTGWNSKFGARIPVDEVMPVFGAYVEAPWAGHIKKLPLSMHYVFTNVRNDSAIGADLITGKNDGTWMLPYDNYPFATCELGAGIHSTHHRRVIVNGMDAYALSLVKLGSGNNLVGYYMYHGGTNKVGKLSTFNESKATGYPNDYPILNYDFHTCISEYGEVREQYRLLNLLHMFVNDFGKILAPMEYVPAAGMEEGSECKRANDLENLRYAMRTDGNSGFVFINHYQRLAKLKNNKKVVIDTGRTVFPPINICGDTSFIMPFGLKFGTDVIEYATMQPLCIIDDTLFMVTIPGIRPEIKFKDKEPKIKIQVLSWDEARFARKIDGTLYIGRKTDIYKDGDVIKSVQNTEAFEYMVWNGSGFEKKIGGNNEAERTDMLKDALKAGRLKSCDHIGKKSITRAAIKKCRPAFIIPYPEELEIGGKRKITWKMVKVETDKGFVSINERYDVAQIYVDGKLAADNYFIGEPWRVPAKMLYGHECYLVMSELKKDIYLEKR